jgi:predicted nucleic acid-binding protein
MTAKKTASDHIEDALALLPEQGDAWEQAARQHLEAARRFLDAHDANTAAEGEQDGG